LLLSPISNIHIMLQPLLRVGAAGSVKAFSTASSATLSLAGVFHQGTWGRLPTGIPEDVTQQRLGTLTDDDEPPFRRMRKRKRFDFESQEDAQAFLGEERKKLQKLIDEEHNQKHPERPQKKAEKPHLNSLQSTFKIMSALLAEMATDQAIDPSLHQVDHPQPEKNSPVKELGKPKMTAQLDDFAIERISERYAANICELRHNCRYRDQKAKPFYKAYQNYTLKKEAFRGFRIKKEKLQKRIRTITEQLDPWETEQIDKARPSEIEGLLDLIFDHQFAREKINYLDVLKLHTNQDKHPVFQHWKHLKKGVKKMYERKSRFDFEVGPSLCIS